VDLGGGVHGALHLVAGDAGDGVESDGYDLGKAGHHDVSPRKTGAGAEIPGHGLVEHPSMQSVLADHGGRQLGADGLLQQRHHLGVKVDDIASRLPLKTYGLADFLKFKL